MYSNRLKLYLIKVINENLELSLDELELKPEVVIHLVPSWTSETSFYARSVAKKDVKLLYSMTYEQLYPEMKKVAAKDQVYAKTRYEIEVLALKNFIIYYSNHAIANNKTFQELYEPFITDTSDQGIVHHATSCIFEDNDVLYVIPNSEIYTIAYSGINPHTNVTITPYVKEQLMSKYRVELSMYQK